MSINQLPHRLDLPESLQTQLHEFRRRLWMVKLIEATCGAVCGVVLGFLLTFGLDRLMETPVTARAAIWTAAMLACGLIPLALHRWVWSRRKLEQLARLLTLRHPSIGDQLLGIIELVHNDDEQARSRALCEAAIKQVAQQAQQKDLSQAVPQPRHKQRGVMAGLAVAMTVALLVTVPAAATNAWARFLNPWSQTPRFTFAALEALPSELVVPHGEPFTLQASLTEASNWRPEAGEAQLGEQQPLTATLKDGKYVFELPPQIDAGYLRLKIGDARHVIRIEPKLRPELTGVMASVKLPEYLQRASVEQKDVRGGSITLVKGSSAEFVATANRELAKAQVDGNQQAPQGANVSAAAREVADSRKVRFEWQDQFGLAGKEPYTLNINSKDDEAPSLMAEELPRQKVLLVSEQLSFKVRAADDFGVKLVGLDWHGIDTTTESKPAEGERVLSAGDPNKDVLELAGTFSAEALGIEPQPVQVRLFVEDYLPGRARTYSSPYVFYVLSKEQHAIWVTEQLSKWHRQSLEVRDKELALHEVNKQFREMSGEQLDQPENRKRLESQAAAERANGRRLSGLVNSGEDLVRQAMKNPDFGVGHVEKWAEMLQVLKDISGNRMPSVADLLKQSAQAAASKPSDGKASSSDPNSKSGAPRQAGNMRATAQGAGAKPSEKQSPQAPSKVPSIADIESSQQPLKPSDDAEEQKKGGSAKLGLLSTSLAGGGQKKSEKAPSQEEQIEAAVEQQRDLLAEFDKIADELNRVLANLEGSTLVKRLKAASRLQYKIAGRLGDQVSEVFGAPADTGKDATKKLFTELAGEEAKSSLDVSNIMDDMQAYFERRRMANFKTVLEEMKKVDAVGSLRQLGDDLRKENGLSIAQAEYWSDSLDRWAEDLVDASNCGACPGCKSKDSLPPSIVMEVLQILEAEVNLREETRVAEQAKAAMSAEDHRQKGNALAKVQDTLEVRVDKVMDRIRELPNGEISFTKELELLGLVGDVMGEAANILAKPDTGKPAIAAETEAIELLLRSRRFNPKGGGGGGDSPGGGGGGKTNDAALALLGAGLNEKEVKEDLGTQQSSGASGPVLPEEFRSGLDEYFNRLEKRK